MGFPLTAFFAAFVATVGNPATPVQGVTAEQLQAVPLIEPAALDQMLKSHAGIYLLDVRQPDEFAQGHIDGAVLMPLDTLAASYRQLPHDVRLVVYCRAGHRSAQAVEFLLAHGYTKAVSLDGGITAWNSTAH